MAHLLDVFVERGGFGLQSFPFAGADIRAEDFAFDSRALAFEMRQQFLIVFIKFADGSLDRTSSRDPVIPSLAFPSPHHAIMPQPLALTGLHRYCALAAAGRAGRAGRGGTTAGTARERAPFLPTVRIAKK